MLFGSLAFADVGVRAEPPQHLSLRIPDRNGPREEPAIRAIAAAEGKRVFPYLAALKTSADLVHNSPHVVGMMHRLPTPAEHLLQSGAGVVKPALVVPEGRALLIGHPGQLRDVVRHGAETFMAF